MAIVHVIERKIYLIRGQKVMLDSDLARLYGVTTGNLNLAVKRNYNRFPEDFMFELIKEEGQSLLLQLAISNSRGGRRGQPFVFTEQGVAMLSSVLKSERAIRVNVEIMRAFVRLREMLLSNKELARKVAELDRKIKSHDGRIREIFSAIYELMNPPEKPKTPIGFRRN